MISKELLGYLSLLISAVSYYSYIASTLRHVTRPHAFSWLIWGLLTGIAFFTQVSKQAGPGDWATGFVSLGCLTVALIAVMQGDHDITRSDRLTFSAALCAIPLWYVTHDPLPSVILITGIETLGYYPTFRKSYHRPFEENMLTYTLGIVQLILSLCAMKNYALVVILYPLYVLTANISFVLMLLWRRQVLGNASPSE